MPTTTSDPGGLEPVPGRGVAEHELEIGFISGIFGTTGEVRVHLFNRESTMFRRRRSVVLINKAGERFASRLKCRGGAGERVLGTLDGSNNRQDAASFRDWRIVVDRDVLPKLDDDEFYLIDLIGAQVAIEGQVVGVLVQVHQNGPVDILEIVPTGGESCFVPALAEFVADIRSVPVALTPAVRDLLG